MSSLKLSMSWSQMQALQANKKKKKRNSSRQLIPVEFLHCHQLFIVMLHYE